MISAYSIIAVTEEITKISSSPNYVECKLQIFQLQILKALEKKQNSQNNIKIIKRMTVCQLL